MPASLCSLCFHISTFRLRGHEVEDLERFGIVSTTDARPCKHFDVLTKQLYSLKSSLLWIRLQAAVHSTGSTMKVERKACEIVKKIQYGEAVLMKQQSSGTERGGSRCAAGSVYQ